MLLRTRINRLPLFSALVLSLLPGCISAQADSSPATDPPAKTSASAAPHKEFWTHLPKRLVFCVVGTAVGTPIAVVRCTKREIKRRTKEAYDLGGVPKPLGYLSAGLFGIPSGLFCGPIIGAGDAVADSLTNDPFSKGSFSLEKLEF